MKDEAREQWLKDRLLGVGGSDAAAVCGVSSYSTPVDIWLEKTGLAAPRDVDNDSTYWGNRLEDLVIDEYSRRTGAAITMRQEVAVSNAHPFMRCTLDAIAVHPVGGARVLQAKTARTASEWGPSDSDEVPVPYIFQVQHEMAVTGLQQADIAVLIGGSDFRIYPVARDEAIITAMIEVEREFWRCVQERIPPPMLKPEDGTKLFPRMVKGKEVEADEATYIQWGSLYAAKQLMKRAKEQVDEAQTRIMQFMGDAQVLMFQGDKLATWKNTKPGTTLDKEKVQAKYPDVYADCTIATASQRRFLVKGEATE